MLNLCIKTYTDVLCLKKKNTHLPHIGIAIDYVDTDICDAAFCSKV